MEGPHLSPEFYSDVSPVFYWPERGSGVGAESGKRPSQIVSPFSDGRHNPIHKGIL